MSLILFGHKKGDFTGVIEAHVGFFSAVAHTERLFLDTRGEISILVHIKLYQVPQDRIFYPTGSHNNVRFEGRIIAATNKNIDGLRGDEFDLYLETQLSRQLFLIL